LEQWADLPHCDNSFARKLTKRQLHEEQRDAGKDQHEDVGNEECTCKAQLSFTRTPTEIN